MRATLSPRAERLLAALRETSGGKRRLTLDQIWDAFARAHPELRGGAQGRSLLAGLVSELEGGDALTTPLSGSLWERSPSPPLPLWVALPKEAEATPERLDRARFPWAPELAFLATSTVAADDDELLALQAFFRDGGRTRPRVPSRERSVALFGDEKRLDALSRTQLFGEGGLTLETLRCYAMSPPLVWAPGPSVGGPLLVVENHHTWESLSRYNDEVGPWSAVVYGAGKHVQASIEFLTELAKERGARHVDYFGDLDGEGVRIPARAAELSEEAGGPVIVPASALYELLLVHGEPRPDPTSRRGSWKDAIAWLGSELADRVAPHLERGDRLAQEWVGWEVLSAGLPSSSAPTTAASNTGIRRRRGR